MYELKTKPNDADVEAYLNDVEGAERRKDCFVVCDLMQRLSGEEPRMWGSSMVGFGSYHYKYASGHEGDMMKIGFSSRKTSLTLYLQPAIFPENAELMSALGKHKTGKGCLYINKLSDIDLQALEKLLRLSLDYYKTDE